MQTLSYEAVPAATEARRDHQARDERLQHARTALQAHFIGIDTVIDELCDAIRLWYVAPELVTRPVIVNLWGMTGTGKTDLVRRLVAALELDDHFVEIEPAHGDQTREGPSVLSRLAGSGALEGVPTVVLIDEIQRFRTIDELGATVPVTKFSDQWQLLSDGRFPRPNRTDLEYVIDQLAALKKKHRVPTWLTRQLKGELRLPVSLSAVGRLTVGDALDLAAAAIADKSVYRPIDATRCLVVIAGNLDDAYGVATRGSDADLDADTFAAQCRRVTSIDVKDALLTRFRPEQVARFGNTHLVYPSLTRADFTALIDREVTRVEQQFRTRFGIAVRVDESVRALVYRNGVFPVQGVRPVFTTVGEIVETTVARLVLRAFVVDADTVTLSYDSGRALLVGRVDTEVVEIPFTGRLDRIRRAVSADRIAAVAVHEAGHALVHAVELGVAPRQVSANVTSSEAGGFTFGHDLYETRTSLLAQIRVLLAGGLAEEVVFGADRRSTGSMSDRSKATVIAVAHVRRAGFDARFLADHGLQSPYALKTGASDAPVQALLAEQTDATLALLRSHRVALVALATELAAVGTMTDAATAGLLRAHGVAVRVEGDGYEVIPPYAALLAASKPSVRRVG